MTSSLDIWAPQALRILLELVYCFARRKYGARVVGKLFDTCDRIPSEQCSISASIVGLKAILEDLVIWRPFRPMCATIKLYWRAGQSWAILVQRSFIPYMLTFLTAQEEQAPILLDTTWLQAGLTDEFFHFGPSKMKRGWVVMGQDPLAGLQLLRNADADGHGHVQILQDTVLVDFQKLAAAEIDKNIAILKIKTGITDDDIIRVPTLYTMQSDPFIL
ncbi:hypothetical protein HIM_08507 [Hirsutella minnesotensis 3608]|uniref:Protein-arginine deiminase C-terminal domain-containing protein n=1 Tax=Hirsutella minnesotensis 3608 TaxID=1043627 RepID=A0A0F8A3N4_9HYPO|nr:hypothetical protein HIM_08507 [Hirsutella minnesotensis 3608]